MNKKVIIATVYNSENCGSFLQAFALQSMLIKKGYEVRFFLREAKGTSHEFYPHVVKALKKAVRFHLQESCFTLKQWIAFNESCKRFAIVSKDDPFFKEANTVILGSDTIWNFETSYFIRNANVYLGAEFEGKRVVTYAASAGNTKYDVFAHIASLYPFFDQIHAFTVRDTHTQKLIEEYTGRKDVELVCDPTLLLEPSEYEQFRIPIKTEKPYILLYHFEEISVDVQNCVLEFARSRNLDIVSLLHVRPWCSRNVFAAPQNMISYFENAAYILTDTFHGCALSILFKKRFAVQDEKKNKVNEILEMYDKQDRKYFEANGLLTAWEKKSTECDDIILKNNKENSLKKLENILLW